MFIETGNDEQTYIKQAHIREIAVEHINTARQKEIVVLLFDVKYTFAVVSH